MTLDKVSLIILKETYPGIELLAEGYIMTTKTYELGCVVLISSTWKVEFKKVAYVGQS